MRDAKCVVGRREKTSRCFLLYFCHVATITHTHTLHRRLPAYCYCTLDHPQPNLTSPLSHTTLSQHLEPMTAHMLAASLPAATKTKGCRSVNPFIRIHARILLQSLSSISPTTGPIRRPQCSSFAKDLDYSAVGSLEVAKPCCHRSTARHHLVAERRGVNANVYQTGVCQFSDTKTRHDTKGSNTIHVTYSNKNNNTADDVAWLPHHNNGNFHFPPPTKRNRPKPAPRRVHSSNPPRNTSIFRKPKPAVSTLHRLSTTARPARLFSSSDSPDPRNLPLSRLGRIASHQDACVHASQG